MHGDINTSHLKSTSNHRQHVYTSVALGKLVVFSDYLHGRTSQTMFIDILKQYSFPKYLVKNKR